MRRVSKLLLVAATTAVVASGGTVIAYASWPVPSKPVKLKVRAVDMPRGVRPSVAQNGADAVVTWSPQEISSGVAMRSYVVRRHNADKASEVKTFAPVTGTSFTDAKVPTGKWYWTVTAKFADWTGEESRKSENIQFTVPAPTALVATTRGTQTPKPDATVTVSPAQGDDAVAQTPSPVTSPKADPTPPEPTTTPSRSEETEAVEPSPSAGPPADGPE